MTTHGLTTGTHPLQRAGAGRTLYAAGLAADLLGLIALLALSSGLLTVDSFAQPAGIVAMLGFQLVANRLRSRAWWYVPLREAVPVPVRVDLLFWGVFAAAVVVTGALRTFALDGRSATFPLWVLAVVTVAMALLPSTNRPGPEPAAAWWPRCVPMLTATVALLAIGVGGRVLSPVTAAVFLAVAAGATALSRVLTRRWHRR
ncbi:hypothetical protein [Kineococcus rhizosphaerae]|uniref:Uncharacterized protein n=1 Tax=Kineococcus rhizosphaerae TaxID=559628 RepID=A0A2T0R6B4_9ACTN|nr:hypothetical protein [Kineococcus rhizosphaerae]PRY16715.1 hypothetical protein CLV37_103146 [Kineococcus rhizosphaerae]